MVQKIGLQGIEIIAKHGYYTEEQNLGGTYVIDIEVDVNFEEAGQTDLLEDTVNYEVLFSVVKQEMETPSKLIEKVGTRIIDKLYNTFPALQKVRLTINKKHPPLDGIVNASYITIEK